MKNKAKLTLSVPFFAETYKFTAGKSKWLSGNVGRSTWPTRRLDISGKRFVFSGNRSTTSGGKNGGKWREDNLTQLPALVL